MELAEVTEGSTSLLVPEAHAGAREGPGEASAGFYNPAMALTRDLTVLAALAFEPPGRPELLDGLAGAGARGLRVAHETPDWLVTLNDRSHRTAQLARRNLERLGLEDRAIVRERNLNALLGDGRWAFVEVDPYGSPVPFLSPALQAVAHGGILALSATDTSALHGVKARPARRRYMATPPPREAPGWKAAASRLLVGAVVREGARFDRAVEPLLVHHHRHAVRAYLRVREGARAADEALEAVQERVLCADCGGWGITSCPCGEGQPTGPYETRPLHDAAFLQRLQKELEDATLARPEAAATLIEQASDEARLGPFYLDVDRTVKARGLGGPPARADLVEALEQAGIEAARTHYGPTTLAYGGDPGEVLAILDEVARDR